MYLNYRYSNYSGIEINIEKFKTVSLYESANIQLNNDNNNVSNFALKHTLLAYIDSNFFCFQFLQAIIIIPFN